MFLYKSKVIKYVGDKTMVSSVNLSTGIQNAWDVRNDRKVDQSTQIIEPVFEPAQADAAAESRDLATVEADIAQTESELARLNEEKTRVDEQIAEREERAETLKKQIKTQIAKALDEAAEYTKAQKEEIDAIVDNLITKFENGEITKEEMQEQLGTALIDIKPELSEAVKAIMTGVDVLLDELKSVAAELNGLYIRSDALQGQINVTTARLEKLETEKANCPPPEPVRCDPIGFVVDGKICDFIIDRNKDGKFNNESEFLGAQSNWDEMVALDVNSDGVVSAEEMKNAGVQVLVTNEDGTQEIVDVDNDALNVEKVDLASYQSANEELGDENTLLGVFGITVAGRQADGYNTLDTVDWLDKNYSNMFTDKAERKGRFANADGLAASQPGKFNISELFSEIFELKKEAVEAFAAAFSTHKIAIEDKKVEAEQAIAQAIEEAEIEPVEEENEEQAA
jgi:hypothetical protein